MSKSITKKELVSEIAEKTGVKKKEAEGMLNSLRDIAYREARNGFIIPHICKLKVARKKPSRFRNPANGQMMLVGERDVLKAVPLKKAIDSIAPKRKDNISIIEDEKPETTTDFTGQAEEFAQPEPQVPETSEEETLLFQCQDCQTELEAPVSMRGTMAECPNCRNYVFVQERGENFTQGSTDNTDEDQGETPEEEGYTNTVKIDLASLRKGGPFS